MIINISVAQMYKCIDRSLFEKELQKSRCKIFFLKEVLFERPDNTSFTRKIFVTDDTIEKIRVYDDGLRDAIVYFKNKHSEVVNDRQHNDIFLDVKYFEDLDMVVVENKHYDISNEFSTFRIIYLDTDFAINPEKNLNLLKKVVFKKTGIYIKTYIDATKEQYRYQNNKLMIGDKVYSVPDKQVITTSQYKIFVIENECIICLLKNIVD